MRSGQRFIQSAYGQMVWSFPAIVPGAPGPPANLRHDRDETIEGRLAFGSVGSIQGTLGHQLRKVDGQGMNTKIQQAFSHVQGANTRGLLEIADRKNEFMTGPAFRKSGLVTQFLQFLEQIIGIEGGVGRARLTPT